MLTFSKVIGLWIGLFALLMFNGVALAQENEGWQAAYWENKTFFGEPVVQRTEPELNHEWLGGTPDPRLEPDEFSARWTRTINVPPDTYRFTATADDGIRVWVDDELIIDQWRDHSVATFTAEIFLGPGPHDLKVEYYENRERAVAKLTWERTNTTVNGWFGEYYDNGELQGDPVFVRDDDDVRFDWGAGSPEADLLAPDVFSVRWSRSLELPEGTYRFFLSADDGARLYVDERPVIDIWRDRPLGVYTYDMLLSGGTVPVTVEYREEDGDAAIQLFWAPLADGVSTSAPISSAPAPSDHEVQSAPSAAILVDNVDSGFVRDENQGAWQDEAAGYGGTLSWSRVHTQLEASYNWARWYPNVQPGSYEVFVYIPEGVATTRQARYWISHADAVTLRVVDQSANGGNWVSLGAYNFRGTPRDYVSLADVTFETDESRVIVWDAARWEPR